MVDDELGDDTVALRRLSSADVDAWHAGEDDEQVRWFEFPRRATHDDVAHAIHAWQDSWRRGGPVRQWGVWLRESGELIGGVEVRRLVDGSVNLSYVVFPTWRRRGIATRASRLALSYAADQLGARVALIKVLDGNVASLKVAARLGGVITGEERSDAGGRLIVHRCDLASNGERT